MAATFYRKTLPTISANPDSIYTDLYDNNNTTMDIQVGVVNEVLRSNFVLQDAKLAEAPTFGDAKVVGAKSGLYINSITPGNLATTTGLKIWNSSVAIGSSNEGGKTSAGTMVADTDIAVFSSYLNDFATISETFDGWTEESSDYKVETLGNNLIIQSKPFFTREDGYNHGYSHGKKGTDIGIKKHHARYGQVTEEHGEIYYIEQKDRWAWRSTKKSSAGFWQGWGVRMHEQWGQVPKDRRALKKLIKYGSVVPLETAKSLSAENTMMSKRVNENNSNFTAFGRESPLVELRNGNLSPLAFCDTYFASDNVLSGGQSAKMHAFFPAMQNCRTNIHYPKRGADTDDSPLIDNTENRQVTFMSMPIPTPTKISGGWQSTDDYLPTIEIDFCIEKLALMLKRTSQSPAAGTNIPRRLNRAFAITLGKHKPVSTDDLFTYALRHNNDDAPINYTSDANNLAEDFVGLAYVNDEGKIKYQELDRSAADNDTLGGVSNFAGHATNGQLFMDGIWEELAIDTLPEKVANEAQMSAVDYSFDNEWVRLIMTWKEGATGVDFVHVNPSTLEGKDIQKGFLMNIGHNDSSSQLMDYNNAPLYLTLWLVNYPALHHGASAESGQGMKTFTGLSLANTLADDGGGSSSYTDVFVYKSADTIYQDENYVPGDDETARSVNTGGKLTYKSREFLNLNVGDFFQIDTEVFKVKTRTMDNPPKYSAYRAQAGIQGSNSTEASHSVGANIYVADYVTSAGALKGSGQIEEFIEHGEDMESIVHIDRVAFVNFSPQIENATVSINNKTQGKIRIPEPTPIFTDGADFGWANDDMGKSDIGTTSSSANTTYPDWTYAKQLAPSYLCFGFNAATDVEGGNATNTTNKTLLLSGYNCARQDVNAAIFQPTSSATADSEASNIRAGYTHGHGDHELGQQQSALIFDNDAGTPSGTELGLEVGNVSDGSSGFHNEIGLRNNDSTTVESFTQKGYIHFNFDVDGTTGGTSHNRAKTFDARECIFTSARPLKVIDQFTVVVDQPQVFGLKDTEEYRVYKYSQNSASSSNYTDSLKVEKRNGNEITFNNPHGLSQSTMQKHLISPKRFWIMFEIFNVGTAIYGERVSSSGIPLPEKTYDNALLTTGVETLGATFNESKFNDGAYINAREVEPWELADNNSIILDKDYGFGAFDEEKNIGGHAGQTSLNISDDVSAYKEIDISGIVKTDSLDFGDDLYLCTGPDTNDDNFKVVVNSESHGTSTTRPYLLTIMEDEKPTIENFKVAPNKENPQDLDFTWECGDDDLWYGLLFVDKKQINNQYHNAIAHIPLNEETNTTYLYYPDKGEMFNQGSDASNRVTGAITATVTADVTGLAGYTKLFDSADAQLRYTIGSSGEDLTDATKEMSLVIHCVPKYSTVASSRNIFYRADWCVVTLETAGTTGASYVKAVITDKNLRSYTATSNMIYADGETPLAIIIVVDMNIKKNHFKLFLNGKLEDAVDMNLGTSTATHTNTLPAFDALSNDGRICIGNDDDASDTDDGFNGQIEEVVIYNQAVQVVNPKLGKFTFSKPLEEMNTNQAANKAWGARSQNYAARLFIKDYHNIRGTTSQEVATSSQIGFNKTNFALYRS